jgi:hypothetical protein
MTNYSLLCAISYALATSILVTCTRVKSSAMPRASAIALLAFVTKYNDFVVLDKPHNLDGHMSAGYQWGTDNCLLATDQQYFVQYNLAAGCGFTLQGNVEHLPLCTRYCIPRSRMMAYNVFSLAAAFPNGKTVGAATSND